MVAGAQRTLVGRTLRGCHCVVGFGTDGGYRIGYDRRESPAAAAVGDVVE